MTEDRAGHNVEGDKNTIGDVTGSAVAQGEGARAYQAGGNLTVNEAPRLPPPPDLIAAEKVYHKQVIAAYNRLRFSGLPGDLFLNEVPLEDIFVRLTLTVEKTVRQQLPPDERSGGKGKRQPPDERSGAQPPDERSGAQPRERVITVQEPVEVGRALRRNILLIGEPGAGKSTLLRWLAVTFAQGRQAERGRLGTEADRDRVPVLVELGRLPRAYLQPEGDPPAWRRFLPEYIAGQDAFAGTPPELIAEALEQGRCLLLFDGLDEVADPQARLSLASSLAELARLAPGNRLVIGSRPAGVEESSGALRGLFDRCEVARFTPEDVQRFFRFWYALDPSLTEEQQTQAVAALFARVQANSGILRLVTTPLLSTILVILWRNEGHLPERRVELYARCCQLLVEQWERHHAVSGLGRLAGLGWERHLRLLAPLAYTIHSREQRTSAGRAELIGPLADALVAEGLCAQPQAAQQEAEQFLAGLGLRSGLLQHLGGDQYGFPHLTFQEYLVARYLADQTSQDSAFDLLMSHLYEPWWREVHLLTIGYLGSSTDGAERAGRLILTLVEWYPRPDPFLRFPRGRGFVRMVLLKNVSTTIIKDNIGSITGRALLFAAQAYKECRSGSEMERVGRILSRHALWFCWIRSLLFPSWPDRDENPSPVILQDALETLEQASLIRHLLTALEDSNDYVRWAVAASLVQVGGWQSEELPGILSALDPSFLSLREFDLIDNSEYYAICLGQVASRQPEVIAGLLAVLDHYSWAKRRFALVALAQMTPLPPEVMPVLLSLLSYYDQGVRATVAASLGLIGGGQPEVVSALLSSIRDSDEMVRNASIESLRSMAVSQPYVIDALLAALRDPSSMVRRTAAESLGQVEIVHPNIATALRAAVSDPDELVRLNAARSLQRAVPLQQEATTAFLVALLQSADWRLRQTGARSLTQETMRQPDVLGALLDAVSDTDPQVRQAAAESLGQAATHHSEVAMALLAALHDDNENVRGAAVTSLGRVGTGHPEVVPALLALLHDDRKWVLPDVVRSLGLVTDGQSEVIVALLATLRSKNAGVRLAAVESLGQIALSDTSLFEQVAIPLERCVFDASEQVRAAALVATQRLLAGKQWPGYFWRPLEVRRRRRGRYTLELISLVLAMTVVLVLLLIVRIPDVVISTAMHIVALAALVSGTLGTLSAWLGRRANRDPWQPR